MTAGISAGPVPDRLSRLAGINLFLNTGLFCGLLLFPEYGMWEVIVPPSLKLCSWESGMI